MAVGAAALAGAVALGGCGGGPAGSIGATNDLRTPTPTSAASIAAVASVAPTAVICDGRSNTTAPAASTALASGSVLGNVTIGTDAFDVAVADGSVWVVSALDGVVKRLDRTGAKVAATVDLGGKSEDSYLLADGKRLWFTRWGQGGQSTVGWIDMATNELGGTYGVDPVPLGLARDGSSLWVTGFDSQAITELDATTGAIRRSIVVDADRLAPPDVGPTDLVARDGSVWVLGHRSSELIRVEASSGRIAQRICLPLPGPERMELAFGSLWIADPGRIVVRVDPSSGEILAVIPLPDYQIPAVRQPWGLAAGPDRLWIAAGTVAYWIDPATNTIPGFVQLSDEQGALDAADVYPGAGVQNLAVDGDALFAGFPGIGMLIRARA